MRVRPALRLLGVPVMPLGPRTESMRCRHCAATYEPLVDGELNLRQIAEWNHRTERLVATVGVSSGPGHAIDCCVVARAFLIRRGWFAGEADVIVGCAAELPEDDRSALVDELVVALGTLQSVTGPRGMELIVCGLAAVLAAGGTVDERSEQILVRCADAAGVGLDRVEQYLGVVGVTTIDRVPVAA